MIRTLIMLAEETVVCPSCNGERMDTKEHNYVGCDKCDDVGSIIVLTEAGQELKEFLQRHGIAGPQGPPGPAGAPGRNYDHGKL